MLGDQLILDDNRQKVADKTLLNHNFGNVHVMDKVDFRQHLKNLRTARITMLLITLLTLGVELYLLAQVGWDSAVLTFVIVEMLILLGLLLLSFRYASLAFILFLIFYIGMYVLLIALGEANPTDGLLLRIVAIVLLLKGVSSAREAERFRKKLTALYLDQKMAENQL